MKLADIFLPERGSATNEVRLVCKKDNKNYGKIWSKKFLTVNKGGTHITTEVPHSFRWTGETLETVTDVEIVHGFSKKKEPEREFVMVKDLRNNEIVAFVWLDEVFPPQEDEEEEDEKTQDIVADEEELSAKSTSKKPYSVTQAMRWDEKLQSYVPKKTIIEDEEKPLEPIKKKSRYVY